MYVTVKPTNTSIDLQRIPYIFFVKYDSGKGKLNPISQNGYFLGNLTSLFEKTSLKVL